MPDFTIPFDADGRREMTVLELMQETKISVDTACAQKRTFTAYDLTRELRAAHPEWNVRHIAVREFVHLNMREAEGYSAEPVQFHNGVALQYKPLPDAPPDIADDSELDDTTPLPISFYGQ